MISKRKFILFKCGHKSSHCIFIPGLVKKLQKSILDFVLDRAIHRTEPFLKAYDRLYNLRNVFEVSLRVVQHRKKCFALIKPRFLLTTSNNLAYPWHESLNMSNIKCFRFIARSKFIISVSNLTIFSTWWSSLKTITLFILSLNLFAAVSNNRFSDHVMPRSHIR